MLDVSERTLWRLLSGRKVPEPVRIGRNTRWRLAEVNDWIERGLSRRRMSLRVGRTGRIIRERATVPFSLEASSRWPRSSQADARQGQEEQALCDPVHGSRGQAPYAKGFTDKGLTEQLAAKLENEVLLRKRGMIDPAQERLLAIKQSPDRRAPRRLRALAWTTRRPSTASSP